MNFGDFTDGGVPSALDYVAGYAAGGGAGSDRRWLVGNLNYGVYNVMTYGADPTGVADSGPAFRAVMGSNRIVVVPPGNYHIQTVDTPPFSPHVAAANVDSFENFLIYGYGATITMDAPVDIYSVFVITRCRNFRVYGLTFANKGIGLFSDVGFRFSDLTFDIGVTLQCFFGDFLINGTLDHIEIRHGQAVDMAYITHMNFDDIRADGGGDTLSGTCFGISGDTASLGLNDTGVTITESNDVSFTRCNVTGYTTGAYITEGEHYTFRSNHWHGLDHPSISPTGIYIGYSVAAATPSTGHPVYGVVIDGDFFHDNGATTPGVGILIDASAVVNADKVGAVLITNSHFHEQSYCGILLAANSATHTENLMMGVGNLFHGPSLTLPVDPYFMANSRFLCDSGFGYIPANASAVTQQTDKTTTVALNFACGDITMNNATLNAGVIVSFVLQNTFITGTSLILCNHVSGGTLGAYSVNVFVIPNNATFHVRNNTAGNLSEAIVLRYAVIAGG